MNRFFRPALAVVLSACAAVAADVDKVRYTGSKVYVLPGDKVLEAPDEAKLGSEIVVKTNGTFSVKGGKARQLADGDTLAKDGMLTRRDGSVFPVVDHVSFNRGRVLVMKDGDTFVASQSVRLGNGTVILPEGKVTLPSGASRRLLDGELFKMDGSTQTARDSITLEKGRVKVQKDGSPIFVEPGRSVMMNDGTKVHGDGKVIRSNGETLMLKEGEVITIDGVVRK